jgi:hypothetical protein
MWPSRGDCALVTDGLRALDCPILIIPQIWATRIDYSFRVWLYGCTGPAYAVEPRQMMVGATSPVPRPGIPPSACAVPRSLLDVSNHLWHIPGVDLQEMARCEQTQRSKTKHVRHTAAGQGTV